MPFIDRSYAWSLGGAVREVALGDVKSGLPKAIEKDLLEAFEAVWRSRKAGWVRRRLHSQSAIDSVLPQSQLQVQTAESQLSKEASAALKHENGAWRHGVQQGFMLRWQGFSIEYIECKGKYGWGLAPVILTCSGYKSTSRTKRLTWLFGTSQLK